MTENNELKGVIFDIQRYSIHDGPGIRTTVFLKGCPLKCFWCQNPESQKLKPQVLFYKEKCTKCGRCIEVCTTGASSLSDVISEVDREKCIGCGKCVEACPNEARKLSGRYVTGDDVIRTFLKDVKYYENSGGGITLSGGEPLFQQEFTVEFLQKCKSSGLHTVLETCGLAPWPTIEETLTYVDYVLYDIKHMDAGKHEKGTGRSNELILENAKMVAACKPMKVRTPLIPGFNDSPDDIGAIAHFVKSKLGTVEMELLAYNKMGESKYERLGRKPCSLGLQDEQQLQSLQDIVSLELCQESNTGL